MDTRKIQCREHGGYFEIPLKRGRPPVKCSPDNQCDVHRPNSKATAQRVAKTLAGEMPRKAAVRVVSDAPTVSRVEQTASAVKNGRQAIRKVREAVDRNNLRQATLDKARVARDQLEALGWLVAGKGHSDADGGFKATLTATRGEELLLMTFANGMSVATDYQLWTTDKPSKNGKPNSKLPFDPDEIPDNELALLLHGMKITWWNRLGGKAETAIVSPDKVTVEHIYDGKGNETPGERIVKFVEHGGSGFRGFRLDALMKVG